MKSVAIYYTYKGNNDSFIKNNDLKQIELWCRKRNYNYTFYIDDIKNGNDIENRFSLNKLKRDIQRGYYSNIVIINLSNLSQDITFSLEFIDFALKYNCKVVSMDGINLYSYKKFVNGLTKAISKLQKVKK